MHDNTTIVKLKGKSVENQEFENMREKTDNQMLTLVEKRLVEIGANNTRERANISPSGTLIKPPSFAYIHKIGTNRQSPTTSFF